MRSTIICKGIKLCVYIYIYIMLASGYLEVTAIDDYLSFFLFFFCSVSITHADQGVLAKDSFAQSTC